MAAALVFLLLRPNNQREKERERKRVVSDEAVRREGLRPGVVVAAIPPPL